MKLESEYMLYKSEDKNYLLPYGQKIVLQKRGIELNDTGVLLWNAIKSGKKEEDLISVLFDYYGLSKEHHPVLEQDIHFFLNQLRTYGILSNKISLPNCTAHFDIGGLSIHYHGPKELLHPNLLDFFTEQSSPAGQNWYLIESAPITYPTGNVLLRNHEIEIIQTEENYIITLYTTSTIQIKLSFDGEHGYFYYTPPYDKNLIESLFHAFRHAFLFYSQKQGRFVIHSSSILYKGKAVLFSAPAGTGKSTQADYWKDLFQTPILNGDLNLLWMNPIPTVSGLPWCGTSELYSKETYMLGAIILLKQGAENKIETLTQTEQSLSITKRLISPAWTEKMLLTNLNFTKAMVEQSFIVRYYCKKEPESAKKLEDYLKQLIEY